METERRLNHAKILFDFEKKVAFNNPLLYNEIEMKAEKNAKRAIRFTGRVGLYTLAIYLAIAPIDHMTFKAAEDILMLMGMVSVPLDLVTKYYKKKDMIKLLRKG